MPGYLLRSIIRKLPGVVIKAVPKPEVKVTEGFGSRGKAADLCSGYGYSKVLVLTDRTLFSLGFHELVCRSLERNGIGYAVFSDIASEPTTEIVDNGRKAAMECGAQCIIALGGGSVMDAGKMIAAGVRLKKINEHFLLLKFLFVPDKTLPIINIPSTAGTGAETTVGAVITDTVLKVKSSTVIVGLNVTDVILDSELTVGAPRIVTAACGIDALSHGLEGCVADVNVASQYMVQSRECVKLVLENLPRVLENPEDLDARNAMCRAAYYGGVAINIQLAGYVHAFAHSIGATYHIPHGQAIALCLMPVMRHQGARCARELDRTAQHCGMASGDELLEAIERLVGMCGFEKRGEFIERKDYWHLTRLISKDSINYSAPVTLKDGEIHEILDKINSL